MARTSVSFHLYWWQKDKENKLMSLTDDSDRADILRMYNKSKITSEDMLRDYTPAEVRELCERTKVRVNMHKFNPVWNAKKFLDKNKWLQNMSESSVNRMLVRAESWDIIPWEKSKYKHLAACRTKKANNERLDRWHRQRAEASSTLLTISDSESEAELELLLLPESPFPISVESLWGVDESFMDGCFQPPPVIEPPAQPPLPGLNTPLTISDSESVAEPELQMRPELPSPISVESLRGVDESFMDGCFQPPPVIEPPAQPPLPGLNSEPNLNDISNQDEVADAEASAENEKPLAAVAETQLDSFDWNAVGNNIN